MAEAETVACRTPAEGRDGVTNIPKWKFDLLAAAILDLAQEPIAFRDLKPRLAARLHEETKTRLGSLGWHLTTIKLELEVRGALRRLPVKSGHLVEAVEG